ncbi:hypothetical protein GGH94_000073 [Coemansia aciculifera]|uniref:Myb-like domain-containing protein n=1 Tax=Coemansia aciculifera TaxID=417176 RepID=A0A9W8M680_9FUNG|nr:hypothetical protein GGH94_000073 [Coemansia aciculifera]KAJ2877315.1 hypothetical protein GGH93_000056 [Coemansia aciculifera]
MGTHDGGHGGPSAAAIAAAAASHTGMAISNSTHWSTEETKLLIRTWGDHREEFAEIKRNLSVWNKVLERLLNAGFVRTVEQCRNRWKFLETKYKTAARDIGSAGCTAWEFFDDMDLAKYGTTHRRNSSSSSAGMHRHLYESPSQSPSQQNSVLSMSSSQQLAQTQHQTALFADPYGRMLLPPIRPGAVAAPSIVSTDSARSMRHGSPALPVAVSSSQHSRLYQPRQSSPSANYTYHHNLSSAASSCPTHLHPPSQPQYYEAVATSTPPPPPPRRLSPLLLQQQQRSPQKQQLRQQAKLHRPPAGRSLTSQIQQQLNLRHPASPSVTYSHHPLAAGHLPESHSSTPDSTSPTSASIHAHPGAKVNVGSGYSNQSHAPTASSTRQHLCPDALGHTAYCRASSGPAELRVPSTRIDSNIIHAKLAHGATISSAQQPVSTLPPADKASAHHDRYKHHRNRTMSADDDSGRSHSEQGLRPSNEGTQSDVRGEATDKATTAVHIDRRNSDSRSVSADITPLDVSVSRKRKLQRTSMLLASNESEADRHGNEHGERSATNDVELVGTISRADLLDFLREQSQQRQQRESLRTEERRRNEDIRREEEWRFHEYQMSLIQLIQHSLVPFTVDGDSDLEQIDVARAPPVVSPRNPGREEETEGSADSLIAESRATEPSAKPPAESILSGKANSAEEVEMQSRTPSPGADDLGVSVSSPSLPQAEHSRA